MLLTFLKENSKNGVNLTGGYRLLATHCVFPLRWRLAYDDLPGESLTNMPKFYTSFWQGIILKISHGP